MKQFLVFALSLLLSTPWAIAQSQVTAIASRTSGVAPLAVFFDATATTDPAVTARPFHELEYRWNFGDTAAAWARGARPGASSKNTATGPVAAHVYERPGTYTASVTVYDGRTPVARQVSITVADPNTTFAGTRTVCFSTGARGFSGCPASAQQVRTGDYASAIATYKGSGKRLLFRRGETFVATSPGTIDVDGPGIVGAFGPTTDPLPILKSNANANALQFSSSRTPNLHDWRVMDLQIVGNATPSSYGVAMNGGISQLTLLRLNLQRHRVAVIADYFVIDWYNKTSSTSGHRIWDQFALVDSNISAVNHSTVVANKGYAVFIAADRFFCAGNSMDSGGTSATDVAHVARFPYLAKAVLSNNDLLRPGPGDHVLKLHAPPYGGTSTANRGVGAGYTRWVVISDNKIVGASNPWMVAVGPQNSQSDERVKDVISERNWVIGGPGMQVAQIYFATDVTSRNNIVDSSLGSASQTGLYFMRRGIEPPPTNIRIYNETFYTAKAIGSGQFAAIALGPGVANVSAWNNVAYAPNATNPLMVRNSCGGCLTAANNTANTQIRTSLPFSTARPTSPIQFKAAGYAVGSGRTVPTWSDFFITNIATTTRRDLGAVFH